MSFELSSLGKEFKKNLEGGGKESKIWNYIHPWKNVFKRHKNVDNPSLLKNTRM